MIDDAADLDNQDRDGSDDASGGEPPDDLIGAYLLDALTEEERAAFAAHLQTSEAARREVAQLQPVVDLLPLALEGSVDDPAFADAAPAADLRHRILAAARAEGTSDADAPAAASPAMPGPSSTRRAGRQPAAAKTEPVPLRPARATTTAAVVDWIDRIGWSRLAAAVFALLAAGTLIWALTLRDRLNETEDEVADLEGTATAAAAGDAVQALAYIMRPTADGPETAGGVLFPQPEDPDTASLNVLGLPTLPEGEVYQLWFVELDEQSNPAVARPSVIFGVDDQGNGSAEAPLPAAPFDIVAVTREPIDAIDDQPNLPILMTGAPGTAAG